MMPGALRLNAAFAGAVNLHVQLLAVKVTVEQRDTEVLAFAGAFAMEQGGADGA